MWFIKLQCVTFLRSLGRATQDPQEAYGYAAASEVKHRNWLQAADFTVWDLDLPLTETQNTGLNVSNWIISHTIVIEHVENRTVAFHSLLLYQSCTQTKQTGDQMESGVSTSYVRITNSLLQFSNATDKNNKTKDWTASSQNAYVASFIVTNTYCYERNIFRCSFLPILSHIFKHHLLERKWSSSEHCSLQLGITLWIKGTVTWRAQYYRYKKHT